MTWAAEGYDDQPTGKTVAMLVDHVTTLTEIANRLTGHVERLTSEVAELRGRVADLERAERGRWQSLDHQ